MKKTRYNSQGFTILELIIATTVFGVMMLVATTGMMQIGRAYYKGIVTTKTQETTRSTVEDITRAIQFGGNVPIVSEPAGTSISLGTGPGGMALSARAFCVGNQRYTYVVGRRIDTKSTAKHALWFDIKLEGKACLPMDLNATNPSNSGPNVSTVDPTKTSAQRELLTNGMRLAKFSIVGEGKGASVTTKVIFGDDDLLDNPTDVANSGCISTNLGGQYCAFSELYTFVTKRL